MIKSGRQSPNIGPETEWNIIYKSMRWKTDRLRLIAICTKTYIDIIWKGENDIIFENKSRTLESLWVEIKKRTHM